MTDWRHRAKGLGLLAAVVGIAALVVASNPGSGGLAILGVVVFGVVATLVGLAWLVLAAAAE